MVTAGALGQPTAPVEVRADHVGRAGHHDGRATSAEVTSPAANRSAAMVTKLTTTPDTSITAATPRA